MMSTIKENLKILEIFITNHPSSIKKPNLLFFLIFSFIFIKTPEIVI